ncbi:hypothetical protein LCI18_003389 [Fusarium solani-melongenae]|uniref:Uncharacterized protein n=1 Tax=Fusarium solani subsp. cucurbitae TaxID=2747967 RepID=A0ACD3YU23_FUSSC|nr:hypothetical protein LCI18_003389 [Fusarium solani-melongenae]
MAPTEHEQLNHKTLSTSLGLAPLTDKQFKSYNRLAEKMQLFHDHFKRTWQFLEDVCEAENLPDGLQLDDVIDKGLSFCSSLEMHHNIEEAYLFPLLARRMPYFRDGNEGPLLEQHRVIHKGLSELNDYFVLCRSSRSEFDYKLTKSKMDSWGGVLKEHLDTEVRSLGAENMRKYWTVDEVNWILM